MDLLRHGVARRALVALLLCASTAACVPDLGDGTAVVTAPRVVAVRAEPAEAQPGTLVTYTALYASGAGNLMEAPLDWAYCLLRKPLSELGPVNRGCLVPADERALLALGEGASVSGPLPREGCRLFGPNPPAPREGEPAGRPVDPDPSGGFYQPVRLRLIGDDGAEAYSLFEARISCGAAGTTQEEAVELARRWRANSNPALEPVLLVRGLDAVLVPAEGAGEPPRVAPGETVRLNVGWPDCPPHGVCGDGICGDDEDRTGCGDDCRAPRGCGGAETYVAFDPVGRSIVRHRETMRVSWLSTAGTFAEVRTGREGSDAVRESDNEWTAPTTTGEVVLWIVLRDERGGTTWQTLRVSVAE